MGLRRTVLLNNITGSGGALTTNTIPKATGPETLGDSTITDSGTAVVTTSTFQATTITATTGFLAADAAGDPAAPSYSFSSDSDNGMFLQAANQLGFSVGGTGRLFIQNTVIDPRVNIIPDVDNSLDLGSSSNRFRTEYLGTALVLGTNPAASGTIRTASGANITTSGAGGLTIGSSTGSIKQAFVDFTDTSGGVTGNQTINKMAGSVNAAAASSAITVTNSLVTTSTKVFAVGATNDSTFRLISVVPGSNTFTMNYVSPAAETRINWFILNTD